MVSCLRYSIFILLPRGDLLKGEFMAGFIMDITKLLLNRYPKSNRRHGFPISDPKRHALTSLANNHNTR